ncbi:MAG TPA: ribonuclease R [Candidatus Binatia bacterium]
MADLQDRIVSFLGKRPRQRLTPAEILKGMGAARDELNEVVAGLRALAKQGRVVRLKKNHYALPGADNCLTGRVHAHPDGFGFLIPDDRDKEDLYLSRREMRRVMHGDRVMVRVERTRGGAVEAHVAEILEHGQKRLVGTYEEHQGQGYLIPTDPRIAPAIALGQSDKRPEKGAVIAAELTRYASGYSAPEARVVETLGDPNDPEIQARAIIFQYALPTEFSPAAKRGAEACPQTIPESEIASRVDLRALPIVTIDGEKARDFDDAVCVEKSDGGYRLHVSIADVAHYVRPGSALDEDAYARGTSVYFPDRALPMLPEELSNGICSLNPNEDRLTKTAMIEFGARGEVLKTRFFNSVIRSHARMTYTEVRQILVDKDAESRARYRALVPGFERMEELALLLYGERRARGTLDFDLPEAEIVLDLQGNPENIVRAERSIAHRIIEEFMIAANEAVARHLKEKNLPLLYRVHEGPDHEALEEIAPFLATLGYRLPLKHERIQPKELQKILDASKGKPEEKVVNHVLLRAMKQAHYAPDNIGHFGLASLCYAHFTSPIRRYPDLIVHRMLDEALKNRKLKANEREELDRYMSEAGKHTSERERVAMDAEREMVGLKKAQFMMDKIGEQFAGVIVSLANFGFFVELEDYFVEGLVKLSSLKDDDYHYYEKEYLIKGRRHGRKFRLGDRVRVKVLRINAFRAEIDFELVD